MTQALAGRTVALAEGRQLEELARLFDLEGATALRYPLISILDAPDETAVKAWLDLLCADRFDWIILMTGEAVRRLLAAAERVGLRDRTVAAFGRTRNLTRGPKPGQALKEIGITPTRVAAMPTTDGVIEALRSEALSGLNVGVTLAGGPNAPLVDFLVAAGVSAHTVLPYVYAPAADGDRVVELINRLASGSIDVLLFTSSPQIDRLFDVAATHRIEDKLREGLGRTKLAAIGPVVAESLARRGTPAHIVPGQGFVMKNLVQHVKRAITT